jgi:CBS domain-containing protein
MADTIREIMTPDPVSLAPDASIVEAARAMRDHDIGDVLVASDEGLRGIVTDRDLVVRVLAEGGDVAGTALEECCSGDVVTVEASARIGDAVEVVRDKAIRRIPVVENGHPVGIVSLGDLAMDRDPRSALADVSTARPNN